MHNSSEIVAIRNIYVKFNSIFSLFLLLVIGGHLNTKLPHPDNWAGLLAFLSASLGLALVGGDDGDPGQLVRLLLSLVVLLGTHPQPPQQQLAVTLN